MDGNHELQPGDIKLHVSINELYANWSLWQKQQAKESLWVSETGKLPEAKRVILRGVNLLNYM